MSIIRNTGCFQGLIFAICFFCTVGGSAQIENISISEEVNVDRLYAGLLTHTDLSNRNTAFSDRSSIQLGTRATMWLIPETLRIRSFVAFKLSEGEPIQSIKSYEAIFVPYKKMKIALGVMATPTTELRPNPTTWQSQVETNAESNILGGKPGVKVNYNFNTDFKLTYGVHDHGGTVTQHLKIVYKNFVWSSFIGDGKLFVAAKWNPENAEFVVTRHNYETALSAIVPVSTDYRFYLDMAYNNSIQALTFGEWGLRRYFPDTNLIKGFLSVSYNKNLKQLQGGLFIHI
ncbi:hypothetical protein [uncultured Croceitalea sp.]|uniref:hypothetical protein n=1 Tax=uncultured Croceitalea sp. TaxID=1798908 RepID=UPI0033061305